MGTLLVVQGTATYPVRYRSDHPPRTVQRLPAPTSEAALVQVLHRELGIEQRSVQHLVAEVQRWGSVSMPFDLPDACARLFVPFDASAP
jgi:hypothetical protein